MRKILGLVVLSAVSLVARGHQGRGLGLEDQYAYAGGSVGWVGGDGTLYILQHDSTASTSTSTVTDLIAIGAAATPATTFKVQLTGQIGSVIGGASTVYVE